MNTFMITEIPLHCHSFFLNMIFCFFFSNIFFHQHDSLENVYSGLSLSLSLPLSLRCVQASALLWLMNETQVSFLTLVACYDVFFFKLVFTKFKHRQSCSAPTDRRPDTRWVPKQNAEILHSTHTKKKLFFFPLDPFQCHAHCITSVPIDRVFFFTYKNTLIELGLIFLYVLCMPCNVSSSGYYCRLYCGLLCWKFFFFKIE